MARGSRAVWPRLNQAPSPGSGHNPRVGSGCSTVFRTGSTDAAQAGASRNRIGRIWLAAAVASVLAVVILRFCLFVVGRAEYALVTEFGRPVQVVDKPGIWFKLPYRSVRLFDRRLLVYTPPPGEFLTREKTPVVAAAAILWRIADPKRFFETVFDRAGAESRLGDILSGALGAAIAESPFTSFISLDPAQYRADTVVAEVARWCRGAALGDYGIDVVDVQLQSFDFPKQNRQRVYARMAAERGQISMRYRSEGDEAGLGVRAAAVEDRARIIAGATETAQRHRGEGESEAARIYAAALAADPDFYKFLRTMEAARAIVHRGTTMVLPADSELFGLLYDSNHYSDNAPGKNIDHEGDVDEALPGGDIGEVGDPQGIRPGRMELPVHLVMRAGRCLVADGCLHRLAAHRARKPDLPHQPCRGAACDPDSFAVELPPDFPHAVDLEIILPDPADLRPKPSVALRAGRETIGIGPASGVLVIGRWGDRQHAADRLDPMDLAMRVDERDHGFDRRSSSAAAK